MCFSSCFNKLYLFVLVQFSFVVSPFIREAELQEEEQNDGTEQRKDKCLRKYPFHVVGLLNQRKDSKNKNLVVLIIDFWFLFLFRKAEVRSNLRNRTIRHFRHSTALMRRPTFANLSVGFKLALCSQAGRLTLLSVRQRRAVTWGARAGAVTSFFPRRPGRICASWHCGLRIPVQFKNNGRNGQDRDKTIMKTMNLWVRRLVVLSGIATYLDIFGEKKRKLCCVCVSFYIQI